MRLSVILFAVAVGLAAGQRGGECDLEAAKESLNTCISDRAEEMAAKKEERREEMLACFTDNNCESPEEDMAALKECKTDAINDGLGSVQSCIEDKGLDVPENLLKKLFKKAKRKLFGKGKKDSVDKAEKKAQRLNAKIAKYCSAASEEEAEAAKACVAAIKQERKEAKKAKREERKGSKAERREAKQERKEAKKAWKQAKKEARRNGEPAPPKPEELKGGKGGKGKGKGLKGCMKELDRPCKKALMAELCECAQPLKEDGAKVFLSVHKAVQQCKVDNLGLEVEENIDEEEALQRGQIIQGVLNMICKGGRGKGKGKGKGKGRRGGRRSNN